MTPLTLIVALVVAGVPALIALAWMVHQMSNRLCVRHARRFCGRSGLEIRRVRFQPMFDPSGVKTEFTLVQLDCLDARQQRRLVLLAVWPFGVRGTVRDELYPGAYDQQWPQVGAG